jgi:hypothetical protein
MPDRRIYEDRSNLIIKDIKDQPLGKYVAFVGTVLGEKAAITCDGVAAGPGIITLLQESALAGPGQKGIPVCSFSSEMNWCVVDRDRVLVLTGEEWENAKVEDGKSHKKILKGLFGEEGIAQVVVTPDGQPFPIPASPEMIEKYKEAAKKEESAKAPYDPRGLYA